MTGATGQLGVELVPRLLAMGHEVIAIARKPPESYHKNLSFVQGDVTQSPITHAHIRADVFLHVAALTSLRERNEGQLDRVNNLGTQHVVDYCLAHKIPRLFHTSTLYVVGDYSGVFHESDVDVGQEFKNRYERSKYFAESVVRNHPYLRTTIMRLGILVGRYDDGVSAFFEGFYRPVRAVVYAHRFAEKNLHFPKREKFEETLFLPRLHLPVRIFGQPESTLGITPVDWAAEQVAQIAHVTADRVSHETDTYHIVPDTLPTMTDVCEGINRGLGITGYHVGPRKRRHPVHDFYNYLIRDFTPYIKDQPSFETSVGNTCPTVDAAFLERCVRYWREHDGATTRGQEGVQASGLRSA